MSLILRNLIILTLLPNSLKDISLLYLTLKSSIVLSGTHIYPLDLNSIILNQIWRCHVFVKPKQPKRRKIWFE